MAIVVCTAELPVDVRAALPNETVLAPTDGAPFDWRAQLGSANALICQLRDRIDAATLGAAPMLRCIATYSVGTDHIDLEAAKVRGIVVANTPDVLTDATADMTFALLLAVARNVVAGADLVRAGQWRGFAAGMMLGADVAGQTLGIIGMGRIGAAVARRARGFGMRVLATSRHGGADDVERVSLEELLAASDFVTLHCPLTDETRGLLSRQRLALCKPSAIVINTARGECIDEDAMLDALDAGQLRGAGIDVYANEPHVSLRLREHPRVVATPHLGSATATARRRMAELCIEAVRDVLAGRAPKHPVTP